MLAVAGVLMTRIYTSTLIHKPVDVVFEFVTTPGHWPEWHPSSLAVTGATDHPLMLGEEVTEDYRVAGRRGRVVWRVRTYEPPRHWVIDGQIVGRDDGGTVAYTLTPRAGDTFFEREFTYPTPGFFFTIIDRLFARRRIQAESAEAMANLTRVLQQR
jgi:uncharacterized protein YndB with AHSA1/START domain